MRTNDVVRALALAGALLLAACGGGSDPKPAQPAPPPAELRVGDLHIMASLADTMTLPQQVTRQYGITRAEDTYLLLVAVRRGADETSVPARVEARARTLNGNVLPIAMRETRTAEQYIDNIGTLEVAPPDTLQFTVQVTPEGAPTSTLNFTREVAR